MDGWSTQARQDTRIKQDWNLIPFFEIFNRRVASLFIALSLQHRLDAFCTSRRVEAGTRSTFYGHLLTLAGKTFTYNSLYIFSPGRKSSVTKRWFCLFEQRLFRL